MHFCRVFDSFWYAGRWVKHHHHYHREWEQRRRLLVAKRGLRLGRAVLIGQPHTPCFELLSIRFAVIVVAIIGYFWFKSCPRWRGEMISAASSSDKGTCTQLLGWKNVGFTNIQQSIGYDESIHLR